ncbi:MAG: ribonuclease III [Lachnospiraceae bacterium]|nr:ribonuclease III [Lachnospiraceae bacterium]
MQFIFEDNIRSLEEKIGYRFKDRSYIEVALTHSSYFNENKEKNEDYERMEFLGDAVLELCVSDHLFRSKKELKEGELTKLRASLVCEPTLAMCASAFNLKEYIRLGKGEENTGGRNRESIISDVFEALIGAIYLDGGLECAKKFIEHYVLEDMYHKIEFVDSKTGLQEYVQEKGQNLSYEIIKESGPAHNREYITAVMINGQQIAVGKGRSKKLSEQDGAYKALAILRNRE